MLTLGWVAPTNILNRIEIEILLFVVLLTTLYILHDPRGEGSDKASLTFALVGGIVVTMFSLYLEPVWITFFMLWIRGSSAEAERHLNSAPHANVILFMGLSAMFVAVVGFVRLGLLKLVGRFTNRI